ncbi:MAG: hypothetical protein NC822_06545, partial [Candidatus Omnitrophica bacterium]|nr:hypothetical protein [Candidatus Omnitrophota bacterium]
TQGMLHILYIVSNTVLVFEFNKYIGLDKKAEKLRQQKPKIVERRGHSCNVPLVGRNPHPMPREKGLNLIANLIEKGIPFFVAFMDIDDMTKYHEAFGKHLKLAGKVRLIIEEVIEYMNEEYKKQNKEIKIYQIKGTEDESFILIQGVKEEGERIIEEIRQRVAVQSSFRLAVAELENVHEFNRDNFEVISGVIGYDIIKHGEAYTILFDILPNKTVEESLNIHLESWNEFLLLEQGIYLRAKVVSVVPAFSISIAGAFNSKLDDSLPIDKDKRIEEAEKRLIELVEVIDPKLDQMKKRGPKRVTEITEKFQPIKKEIQRASIASANIPDELAKRFQGDIAIIVLKGGRLGGLYSRVKVLLLDKLGQHFKIQVGGVKKLLFNEILQVWGHAIKDRLERLRGDLEEEADKSKVNEAIGYIESNNGGEFDKWIKVIKQEINQHIGPKKHSFDNPHFHALVFLWDYLNKEVQVVILRRKADTTNEKIINKYALSIDENSSLQDIVNAIVGDAAHPLPKTLRAFVRLEVKEGVLSTGYDEARKTGVPEAALFATANAIHCPSYKELTEIGEYKIWEKEITAILNEREEPKTSQGPPVQDVQEIIDLNSAYTPTIELEYRTPTEIIQLLQKYKNNLANLTLPEYQKELLERRLSFFIQAIKEAYQSQDRYTYYHALVAISHFLVKIAQYILQDGGALNIYIARDAANFWLAGYMLAEDKETFNQNNIIFHLSREKMGIAHRVMGELIDETTTLADKGNFWNILIRKFKERKKEDYEFNEIVERIKKELPNLDSVKKIRIIESMAEGIITAFLKAIILENYKDVQVIEFVALPKFPQDLALLKEKGREIETFKWSAVDRDEIEIWFSKHKLSIPEIIYPEEEREGDLFSDKKLLLKSLQGQIYHLHYPYSEVNLGHPIEASDDKIVRSSAVKQLGFYLRQILLINAIKEAVEFSFVPQQVPEEQDLYDYLIMRHSEILLTVADNQQGELLARLRIWIDLLKEASKEESKASGDRYAKVIQGIKDAHQDSQYSHQLERFIFELRQFETFDDTYLALKGLVGREGATPEDFYKVETSQSGGTIQKHYPISDIANELREAREAIARERRRRIEFKTDIYGEERTSGRPDKPIGKSREIRERIIRKILPEEPRATSLQPYLVSISARFTIEEKDRIVTIENPRHLVGPIGKGGT